MIQIVTHPHFLEEKKYVFQVLFTEILELPFSVRSDETVHTYHVISENGVVLEFQDTFFSKCSPEDGYCKVQYIPQTVEMLHTELVQQTIPVLYGNTELRQNDKAWFCGADIIASSFFMLSRWEEYALASYDKYGRIEEQRCLAIRCGFIQLPIVHMYAALVQKMFEALGYTIEIPHRFTKTLSHDIDFVYKWNRVGDVCKTLVGDLVKRKSFQFACSSLKNFLQKKDPYFSFQQLMYMSEQVGLRSTFYFLYTPQNVKAVQTADGKKLLQGILERGHSIGYHGNYYLEQDHNAYIRELHFWQRSVGLPITKNRQHFLKIQVPQSFRLMEAAGITQDSSMYYRNYPGFRTGMCIEHSLFDIEQRRILQIKELPLTLMDVSLLPYSSAQIKSCIDSLMEQCITYQGNFVCLWHNSSFDLAIWNNVLVWYSYIVNVNNR